MTHKCKDPHCDFLSTMAKVAYDEMLKTLRYEQALRDARKELEKWHPKRDTV